MKKKKIKYAIAIVLIIIFTFSMVPKGFQNDTFYLIELGKSITERGVDWQDHYSIHKGLEYRYPHWAFDVVNFMIYQAFGFTGTYVFTQIFASVFILIVFWNMIRKGINFNVALIGSLVTAYLMEDTFCMRAQTISYSLFLLEYMILENFVERPTFFKTIALGILSCIMANIHSTAWIMMLILVLPFIGEQVIYLYTLRSINERMIKRYEKKYEKAKKVGKSQEELEKLEKRIQEEKKFRTINDTDKNQDNKIIIEKKSNIKYIWIAIIALAIGMLCTPIKLTPVLYVLKTSAGNSMKYINEHLPVIFANNLPILFYTIIMVAMLGFTKSKLKLYDAFLVLGLYLMSISSRRNVYLLVGLTAGIVVKMIDDFMKENTLEENKKKQKNIFVIISIMTLVVSIYMFIPKINQEYISKEVYPVKAVEFIKKELDYKNIRLYNEYSYGSYLLMEGIPVFIDSRCDLYTPQFNKGVTIFQDSMDGQYGTQTVKSIMEKYQLEYALVPAKSVAQTYMEEDENYLELYKDDNFAFYQYEKK